MKKNLFFICFLLFVFVNPTDIQFDIEKPILDEPLMDLTLKDFPEPEIFGVDKISQVSDEYKNKDAKKNGLKESITEIQTVKIPRPKIQLKSEREKYFNLPINKEKDGVKEISICTTLPKTGSASVIGEEIFSGMNLAFNEVNEKGGINGFTIKLYFYDDKSSFAQATKNIEKLVNDSPLFINLFGLERMYAIEPYMKKGIAFDLFPVVGSSVVRDMDNPDVIYFRASEKKEIEKLLDYSVKIQNKKAISIFYERSESGQATYEYAKNYLKNKYNLDIVSVGSYSEYTVDVLNAIKEITQRIPSAILCIADARATYNFIRRAINSGLHHCLFLGLSPLNVARETLSKARGVNVVTSSVVPDPEKSELLIAKEYREDMKKYLPTKKLTRFSFEGYINAQIFIQVLKDIKGQITTAKIFESLQKLKKMKFRGLKIDFGVEPGTLSSEIWLEED
ncbi:MAG: ABC transporter substrate-binding protein [bacterium]